MTTLEEQVRQQIMTNEDIAKNVCNDRQRWPRLRGKNMVTPYFACFVTDEEGDVAEISFDVDMRPLLDDPVFGVTYVDAGFAYGNPEGERLHAKSGAVHSVGELVAKLWPSTSTDALDVWLRIPEGEDEAEAEANTFVDGDGFRVDWSLTSVGLIKSQSFATRQEASAWLTAEGFQDFTS